MENSRLLMILALFFLMIGCTSVEKHFNEPAARAPASVICGVDATNDQALKSTIRAILRQRIAKFSKSNFKYEIDAREIEISGWEIAATDILSAKVSEHILSKGNFYFRRFKAVISTPDGMLPYMVVEGYLQTSSSRGYPEVIVRLDRINSNDMKDIISCRHDQLACVITNQVFGDRLFVLKCPIQSIDDIQFRF